MMTPSWTEGCRVKVWTVVSLEEQTRGLGLHTLHLYSVKTIQMFELVRSDIKDVLSAKTETRFIFCLPSTRKLVTSDCILASHVV